MKALLQHAVTKPQLWFPEIKILIPFRSTTVYIFTCTVPKYLSYIPLWLNRCGLTYVFRNAPFTYHEILGFLGKQLAVMGFPIDEVLLKSENVSDVTLRAWNRGLPANPMAQGDRSDFHVIYPAAWKLWSFHDQGSARHIESTWTSWTTYDNIW